MTVNSLVDKSQSRLKSRSITALRWSAIDVAGRQCVTFAVTLILARLLSPAEFGLIGMLSLFVALASSIVDSGLGSALIQRKTLTEADKSSVFYFNAAMGAAMAIAVFSIAPWVAQFYRQPVLLPLTRWMALNLFIESFGVVQVALLTRKLDFRPQFKAGFAALIISGVVAIWMASNGFGVWSLVAQTLISTSVFTCLIWVLCSWKPAPIFRLKSLLSLYGFGSLLLLSGLLNTLFDRIQLAVIGKSFSAMQLGYYTRACSTQQFPVSLLSTVVTRVTLPVFSQASQNVALLRKGVHTSLISLMLLTLPTMLGLAVVAKPLVLVLFGAKWAPCVPYLQILCIAGVFWPIHIVNLNVTMAVGRADLFLRLEIVKKLLIGLGVACTFRISVIAMVWAVLIVSMLSAVVNTHYSKSLIGYGVLRQMIDLAPYVGIAAVMAAVTWVVSALLNGHPLVQLIASIATGGVLYFSMCLLLKLEGVRFAIALLFWRRQAFSLT